MMLKTKARACTRLLAFAALLFLLLCGFSIAVNEVRNGLHEGEKAELGGKAAKVLSISKDGNIEVEVDGRKSTVMASSNLYTMVNGMELKVLGYSYDGSDTAKSTVSLGMMVQQPCGDNVCGKGETKESCCADCCGLLEKKALPPGVNFFYVSLIISLAAGIGTIALVYALFLRKPKSP